MLCGHEVICGKYNIGFGIPIEFPRQRKKNIQIGPETTKIKDIAPLWFQSHLGESAISNLESP